MAFINGNMYQLPSSWHHFHYSMDNADASVVTISSETPFGRHALRQFMCCRSSTLLSGRDASSRCCAKSSIIAKCQVKLIVIVDLRCRVLVNVWKCHIWNGRAQPVHPFLSRNKCVCVRVCVCKFAIICRALSPIFRRDTFRRCGAKCWTNKTLDL